MESFATFQFAIEVVDKFEAFVLCGTVGDLDLKSPRRGDGEWLFNKVPRSLPPAGEFLFVKTFFSFVFLFGFSSSEIFTT